MSDATSSNDEALAAFERAVLAEAGIDANGPYALDFELRAETGSYGWTSPASAPDFGKNPDFSDACEAVIAALGLERPNVETIARFHFASGSAPTYATETAPEDPSIARYSAWRESIDARVRSIAGDADDSRGYSTLIGYRLGGGDPLGYVKTVRRDDPVPHWLYVTMGFSEPPPEGELDPQAPSGYGFELTLRVPRDPHATGDAPVGFVVMLQTLARYVFQTGNVFRDGDYTALEKDEEAMGRLGGFVFVADPELGEIATPSGTIAFRSAIGLDARELDAVKLWNTYGFVELAIESGKLTPNGITDPARASFLDDPAFAREAAAGGARDGSRTGHLFLPELAIRTAPRFLRAPATIVTLDPAGADMAATLLSNRIGFGRAVTLIGSECSVRFEPSETTTVRGEPDDLHVGVTARDAAAIASAAANRAKQYEFRDAPLTIVLRA